MTTSRFLTTTTALAATAVFALGACGGGDDSSDAGLSAAAQSGRAIFESNGCGSCHGADAEGGVGPALVGVWGTQVELDDGTTVVADAAYLTLSIKDPAAQKVAGYRVGMPTNNLTDAQISDVVAYIEAIGP